jgi:hypothetical protein
LSDILLQGPTEAMPVNTYVTVTASESGEDEFAFKMISGAASIQSQSPTNCSIRSGSAGESVLEAADAKGNVARLVLRFFDVPS